jgi:hypothetical protein
MYDKVIFFNHYGNGDLFESTAFIEDLHTLIPAKEYIYSHGKNYKIFKHLNWLQQDREYVSHIDHRVPTMVEDNCFYFNTWIGRDGRYVLPGIGCTLEMLYQMYNDMLAPYGLHLKKSVYEYIPNIPHLESNFIDFEGIIKYVEKVYDKKRVLISNGNVQSSQAYNFNFEPIINKLAKNYPNVVFFVTSPLISEFSNIINTENVTKDLTGCDLHEIGFLANYCDLMIGRCSGPIVFAQHKWKVYHMGHKSLSFTYTYEGSHFILSDHLPMKKLWSPAVDEDEVYYRIVKELE